MSRCENCIVRQFNSLRAMSKEELKAVSDSKVVKKLKKGDSLFKEGDQLNGVYCVKDGVSMLSKLSPNGNNQIVKMATKGELLGQRSLVAEEHANLSAKAVADMEVCFISKEHIANTLQNNPDFAVEVLRHMAHDLKAADEGFVSMSQKTVKQRLAATFLYLHQTFGVDSEGFLTISLSREDIADVVGTATESAIRMISDFKKLGLLKTSGKKIGVLEVQKLQLLSDA